MGFRSSHIAAVLVVMSLAGYPLVAGIAAFLSIPSTPISITMRGLLLALSVLLIALNLTRLRRPDAMTVLFLLTLGFYGVRLVAETAFDTEELSLAPSHYWTWYLGVVSIPVFVIVFVGRLDFQFLQRLAFALFSVTAVVVALGGSVEKESGGQLIATGRTALETLNPISLGNVGSSLALLSIWSMFGQTRMRFSRKLILSAALLLGLFLVFSSASRGPLVSTVLAVLVMGFSMPGRSRIWFFLGGSSLIIPAFIYLISIESTLNVNFVGRLSSLQTSEDMSNVIRIDLYTIAFRQIMDYPILGSSIEIEKYASYPHNFYLEYFMATGIFGGLLSLVVMLILALRAARLVRNRDMSGGFALLYIQSFVGAQFSGSVYTNSAFWMTAAVVLINSAHRVITHPNCDLSNSQADRLGTS